MSGRLGLALELLSLPLLASSKTTSVREVLGEGSDGGNSGPKVGGGAWGDEFCSSSDGLSEDEWLEDGEEW